MRTRIQLAVVAVCLLAGCRQILGVDDLTYDLPPEVGGGGAGAQGGTTSTTTTTAGGGGSGGEGGVGGSGGTETTCPSADLAATADGVIFWSTLDSAADVLAPLVGVGPGQPIGAEFVPALSGQGALVKDLGDELRWPVAATVPTNVRLAQGAVDFCLRPQFGADSTEVLRLFWVGGGDDQLAINKSTDGALVVSWEFPPGGGTFTLPLADFTLAADRWTRMTVSWQFETVPKGVKVAIDGVPIEGVLAGALPEGTPPNPEVGGVFGAGADGLSGPGLVDEMVVYATPIDLTGE